jgi:hypothetical protein
VCDADDRHFPQVLYLAILNGYYGIIIVQKRKREMQWERCEKSVEGERNEQRCDCDSFCPDVR